MANITNNFEPGSCVFEAGSTMNGDIYITGGTFYQGTPQEDKELEEGKENGKTSKASQASTPPTKQRNLKPLFPQANNPREEDTEVRRRERDNLLKYLSLHNMGKRNLTTRQNDTLNYIVESFLVVWKNKGLIDKYFSGNAVYRFLHEECGIKTEIDEQSYANKITPWVREKKYSIDVLAEVETFMKNSIKA